MSKKSNISHHSRLHILTEDEIQAIFYLPEFSGEERFSHFSLTQTEFEILDGQRSFASKLNFILQLGYFKSRNLFFNFEFSDVSNDVRFIRRQYFPDEKIKLRDLPKVAVNTLLKHRRTIAEIYNYQFCGHRERKMIEQTAKHSAKISSKRFDNWTTYLYLLCFIHQRFQRLNDILNNCLLHRVRQYSDQSKEYASQKLSSVNPGDKSNNR